MISNSVVEPRSTPVPVGIQTGSPGSDDVFGGTDQFFGSQTLIASASLIKGNTAFKPPGSRVPLRLRTITTIAPGRRRIASSTPIRPKGTTRTDTISLASQEAFVDYHIRNVSDRYDFDSIRIGIQPFSTDFRGFLFQDNQLGIRLFGNRDNNRCQYNLAWFRRLEKDTNSGLNDLWRATCATTMSSSPTSTGRTSRSSAITSQATVLYNRNREHARSLRQERFHPAAGVARGRASCASTTSSIRASTATATSAGST